MTKKNKAVHYCLSEIQLSDPIAGTDNEGIRWVELLKSGTFMHPNAPQGKFTVDEIVLNRMKVNFEENVRKLKGKDLPVNYSHQWKDRAAGWIKELDLREDDNGKKRLFALVEWTPKAREAIAEKEFRYISAELDFNHIDNETGVSHGPTLLGAGLINRPHIKDMEVILQENEITRGVNKMEEQLKELMQKVAKLETTVSQLMAEKQGMAKELEEKKAEMAELSEAKTKSETELSEAKTKLEKVEQEKETAVKEEKFKVFLKEGRITPAQKDAFMKMSVELAEEVFGKQVINSDGSGHGNDSDGNTNTKTAEDQVTELAQAKMKENKELELSEAYSQVLDENPKLREQYEKDTNAGPSTLIDL